MQQTNRNLTVRKMVLVGVLSALVFALSLISIQLGEVSRLHLGNVMCILSGLLFGPFIGGLAAGLGSMFYDFTNPIYISEFWITFLTKFAMGFVAGWLARRYQAYLSRQTAGGVQNTRIAHGVLQYLLPALGGSLTYVLLYCFKNVLWQRYVVGLAWDAVWVLVGTKGLLSLINGVIAVAAATVLAPVLQKALQSAHLLPAKHH